MSEFAMLVPKKLETGDMFIRAEKASSKSRPQFILGFDPKGTDRCEVWELRPDGLWHLKRVSSEVA